MVTRTMAELRKLEERRKEVLKRIELSGDPRGAAAEELDGIDRQLAARMGVTVDQVKAMRK